MQRRKIGRSRGRVCGYLRSRTENPAIFSFFLWKKGILKGGELFGWRVFRFPPALRGVGVTFEPERGGRFLSGGMS